MKPNRFAQLLLLFLLLLLGVGIVFGQNVTQLPDQQIYRGNPYNFSLVLTQSDSALATTAVLSYDKNGRVVEPPNQPLVSRSGRTVVISWTSTSTLPERAWLEIRAGAITRFAAYVNTNKNPLVVTAPGSLTVLSPASDIGPVLLPGSTSRIYPLANTLSSGYVITHNRANRLVTATFFRDDTGLPDPLWRIVNILDNSVTVAGPPGESFTGRLVLNFTTQTSN